MNKDYNSDLSSILEYTEDAIISKSLDGTIQSWNKGSEKMFGYTSEEMIGKNISLLIPPEFINNDENHLSRISNTEIFNCYETTRITKNREQLSVSIIVADIKDQAGTIVGSYQVARNITSQKKNEAELIEANKIIAIQNSEKEALIAKLLITNTELAFQNTENDKRANELIIANQELAFQIQEQEKRAAELLIANLEIDFLHQEEHALFASIVDSSDDAMLSKRLDGIITSWNHGAEKIFGYNADEIIGKSILTLIPPQLQHEEVSIIDKIKSGETVSNLKTERLRKDGTIFYAALTISPIKNLDGDVIGASKVLRDITLQYNSEVEKNQLAERLRLATQSAQIGIWDWDLKNNLLTWDEGMYRLYSVATNEFDSVYEGWFSRLHPDDRQKVQNEMDLALADKKDYKPEFRIVWNDLSVHYINASGIIERDIDGNAIRMIGVNWDITEQKEKEQHLKLLESVITNTTDSILITEAEPFDEPGPRILYVNEAFTKMTGYTAEEVIGKTPRILQGPKSDKAELKRLSEAIRKWQSCEITTINYKKNGEEFWINFTLTPVANEKGWYTHWIAVERDVTIRKNEELQNKLIADISTVFSEPLKLHETLDRTLRDIAKFGDFCFAEAWLASSDQNVLKKISNHATTENMSLFIEETKSVDTFIYGEGLTGVVAKTKEITIWGDLANQKLLRRRDAILKYGLKTIIGLPLLYNNEVIGVLAFGLDRELLETAKYGSLFKKLGDYLSPEIKRKQLELELNQMFNFAPDLIVIIGLDGYFKKVNPAACQLLGYTQEEISGIPYTDFIHPEDKEKSTMEVATLLETKRSNYFENRYITKSGKTKWLAWNAIYVSEYNTIYAVAKDITDKKELEYLLQKVNELARIGGWEVDLQNNTNFWSDITKEIHEVAPDYIPNVQSGIAFYKKGSNRTRITEYVEEAINTGKSWDDEFQIITAKGHERWIRVIGEAEFVNGNCIRIYGSFQDITERKKAEIKLIESENYLRTILDNEPECVKVLNSKGELISMNPAGLAMIEADNEQQVVGHRMTDLVNKEYQIGFNRLSAAVFKGNSGTFEFEITGLKGCHRWLETHAVPLKDTTGKIVNLLGVTSDITARKKADVELRSAIEKAQESDARFKAYAQQSPIAIYTTDINGDCIYANETWLEMASMQLEDALGKGWINALHPDDLEFVTDNWYKSIESNGEWNYEYRFLNSNKNIIWVNGRAKKLFNDKNEHIGYLGSNVNITERKKAEEELRNTEERRKLIMNAALDAIICIDKDGMITFWNPQAEQIFGWSENEVMGKVLSSIIIPEHFRSMHDNGMKNYLKTGKGNAINVLLQLSAIKRNGTEFPIELTVLPISQDGEEFFCAFIRDITERKTNESKLILLNENLNRQKAELVTSNKELEQFAYVASHDLQEPLRMVTSFLTLLEKRYVEVLDEKGLSYINFAVDGAKRMRQIILDILEFSRINTNQEGKYESIDLKGIINDISLMQSKLIKEKKAQIIFEELPKLYSIRHYLMQLFQNIISNALKYSKEDIPLEIIIKSEEFDDYYQIAITDNGIGIEEEYHEKIFIIFQRLHGKEKYEGNGMGLAIVKKIVDKLNGKIWVESQIGVGSTFYFNIPKKIKR